MPAQTNRTRTLQLQDLLRITPQEATAILRRLESEAGDSRHAERRGAPRHSYQHVPRLVVCLQDDEHGLENFFVMVPRNISATGIGVLHGQFVYPETVCVINLKTREGKLAGVRGKVVHCRHVAGRVHELGIRFDRPIDLADILPENLAG